MQELDTVLRGLSNTKSPGHEYRHTILNLGPHDKTDIAGYDQLVMEVWPSPSYWKRTLMIPINKPGKVLDARYSSGICLESYSLISLHGRDKELMSGCEVGLFVDDIVLWHSGPVITAIEDNIDFALEEVWTFA
ncbi:hypothetical protein CDAR_524851 [Caerostris darwini]|uniref:Uncharacterized protein n=1 Tax=Caerostris darwini TaxID=1538125 RepID=A0AAV4QXA3_9ARAC|nr:hypothetical protein CDAR_524851 [Caerostris darwini]